MKALTFVIADRLDELAGEWSNHTPQCEALMMAAKEVMTFEQEEKDRMVDFAMDFMGEDNSYESYRRESALDLFNKTFNTNEK